MCHVDCWPLELNDRSHWLVCCVCLLNAGMQCWHISGAFKNISQWNLSDAACLVWHLYSWQHRAQIKTTIVVISCNTISRNSRPPFALLLCFVYTGRWFSACSRQFSLSLTWFLTSRISWCVLCSCCRACVRKSVIPASRPHRSRHCHACKQRRQHPSGVRWHTKTHNMPKPVSEDQSFIAHNCIALTPSIQCHFPFLCWWWFAYPGF